MEEVSNDYLTQLLHLIEEDIETWRGEVSYSML